ncbi:hypothetical protein N7533_004344 [Penicillium manginii]|uniref:uncharacterized protein n=1 Tax=Penicillium manginii TaxID=203109 RepID=UPI002547F729|nr:uncharacterized protein N7533_004344 [Penicillium manginii]KAJ5754801.1 hypothetical protein N7533_004344 [Penicillium manginii]
MERTESFHGHPLGAVGWVARALQVFSSIIVLGITAWAVTETKTVTVIYTLVISVLSLLAAACSGLISCVARKRRWHVLILMVADGALSYLWLTSFIFLALDFNRVSCHINRWHGETVCSRQYTAEAFSFTAFFTTFLGLVLEILFVYYARPRTVLSKEQTEQHLAQNLNEAGLM